MSTHHRARLELSSGPTRASKEETENTSKQRKLHFCVWSLLIDRENKKKQMEQHDDEAVQGPKDRPIYVSHCKSQHQQATMNREREQLSTYLRRHRASGDRAEDRRPWRRRAP
jgi:hypothetical protein